MTQVIRYLQSYPDLNLPLESDRTRIAKWWVDSSFGVHPDRKSCTIVSYFLGKGSAYSSSVQQKLKTRSSTEAELVGADDTRPLILWTRYVLECQGYLLEDCALYHAKLSTMSLERNGKVSCGK